MLRKMSEKVSFGEKMFLTACHAFSLIRVTHTHLSSGVSGVTQILWTYINGF